MGKSNKIGSKISKPDENGVQTLTMKFGPFNNDLKPDLEAAAKEIFNIYSEFVKVGFREDQALYLTATAISNAKR